MELDKFNPLLTTIRPMSTSNHSPYEYSNHSPMSTAIIQLRVSAIFNYSVNKFIFLLLSAKYLFLNDKFAAMMYYSCTQDDNMTNLGFIISYYCSRRHIIIIYE
jgi:hypothetical protein